MHGSAQPRAATRRAVTRPAAAGLIAVLATATAGVAHAGNYSIHVLGTAEASWTDNLFAVPDEAAAPLPPHEGDVLIRFRPGALFTYETPRTVHTVEYSLDTNLYLDHDEARSLGHVATARGFYLTSPRTELQTSLGFATGTLASLSTRIAPKVSVRDGNTKTSAPA